jgi:small subunit ribosomal protein S3
MGQKVNPIGLRLGVNRTSDSRWYADSADFGRLLHEDLRLRKYIMEWRPKDEKSGKRNGEVLARRAGISKIIIERPHKKCRITVHTSRPGMIIGKKGADIEKLRKDLSKFVTDEVFVNLVEVRKPEIDAKLVAEDVARQLERRVSFRRAMKRTIQSAMRLGAEGIRLNVAGRLGGAEIARTEWYREGRVPLHTLRADIDYGTAEALTTYGIIGIKVWIFKGEIMEHDPMAQDRKAEASGEARARQSRPANAPQGANA